MNPHFQHTLSEEQLAAYLDGMLSAEESSYVESAIDSEPELQEIQEALDEVDSSYIAYDAMEEIPVECLSDDFVLPAIDTAYGEDNFTDDVQPTDETIFGDDYSHIEDEESEACDSYEDDSFGYQDFLS